MKRLALTTLAFLRKLLEVEHLPPPPSRPESARRRTDWVRFLLAPEPLPREGAPRARPRAPPGFLRQVLEAEELPPPPPPGAVAAAPARTSWLRLLLAPEALPPALPAQESPARTRFAALLLVPESLPQDVPSPGHRRRRGRWLEWLFSPEKLDTDSK